MAAFIYELRTVMDMLGFGHRRRGGGKRVVIERSKNERDALAARIVDGCRLPLALISRDGTILVANPACARFVMGMVVEIEGLPLTSTPLAGAWRSPSRPTSPAPPPPPPSAASSRSTSRTARPSASSSGSTPAATPSSSASSRSRPESVGIKRGLPTP
jgi:hypothetical protein